MANSKIKLSLFINFFLFTILVNSVVAVILQAQHYYGTGAYSPAIPEVFNHVVAGVVSFAIAYFIIRIGYKGSMAIAITVMMMSIGNMDGWVNTGFIFQYYSGGELLFSLLTVSLVAAMLFVLRRNEEIRKAGRILSRLKG